MRAAAAMVGDIVYGDGRRMLRDESICTHDRARVSERLRELLSASTQRHAGLTMG